MKSLFNALLFQILTNWRRYAAWHSVAAYLCLAINFAQIRHRSVTYAAYLRQERVRVKAKQLKYHQQTKGY